MLELFCPITAYEKESTQKQAVVHPFYKKTFAVQYGISEEDIPICKEGYPVGNREFLLNVLKIVSKNCGEQIRMFLDIRRTEEYSETAPEYTLLQGIGLEKINPLGIKGMGSMALLQGLQIADAYLRETETVLVCCTEAYTPYDMEICQEPFRKTCGFGIRLVLGTRTERNTAKIEYEVKVSKNELKRIVSKFNGTVFYTESIEFMEESNADRVIYGTHGLTEPFFLLEDAMKNEESMDMLVMLEHKGHYGYMRLVTESGER